MFNMSEAIRSIKGINKGESKGEKKRKKER